VLRVDGLLYQGETLDGAKLVVPETLTQPVIQMHHDKVFAGHQGIKKTRYLLKLHYFWPNINRDVEKLVRSAATERDLDGTSGAILARACLPVFVFYFFPPPPQLVVPNPAPDWLPRPRNYD
jgi:hypothetical protein